MRVTLDISDDSYAEIEDLRKRLGYETTAVLIGRALDLLSVVVQARLKGGEIMVQGRDQALTKLDFPGAAFVYEISRGK